MWTRTGNKGYTLLICHDRAELLLLTDSPPSAASKLAEAKFASPILGSVVVGLLAQGNTLTAYLNGNQVLTVQNGTLSHGKINTGAVADGTNPADVEFADFRVFAPPAQNNGNNGGNNNNGGGKPTPSGSKSTTPKTTATWPTSPPTPTSSR